MGYYFALSKFVTEKTGLNMFKALAVPIVLHGIYDFILMTGHPYLLLAFIPFLIYLWWSGMKKIKHGY
jgi:RsiW-degrading membrane proteinase PrsW (M82 family)